MRRSQTIGAVVLVCCALSASDAYADAPAPVAAQPDPGQHFALDPVSDGAITALGFGFSGLLGLVLSTGEIKPPAPAVGTSSLLPIDRGAVNQTPDPHADMYSTIGLYGAVAFTAIDSLLSGMRDGWDAALVDAFMYAESLSLTLTLTDATKIAVRRPRPLDYKCAGTASNTQACSSTDLGLSFFSGHAAMVASVGATATYIAFVRAPDSPRPWITLTAATLLTAFVSYERVRSGEHFPTDVIAGSLAGAAVGVIVPHLHRRKEPTLPVWVGIGPVPGGMSLTLQGRL